MTSAQGKMDGQPPQGTAVLSDSVRPEDVSLWQLMRGAWVTRTLLLASLVFSIVFWNYADPASRDSLRSFGVLHRGDLRLGNSWSLITSAFLHANWVHWALNAYWLVVVGGATERFFGARRFVGFVLLSILVSSCAEVAAAAVTGIGLSGLVYALLAFVWIGRSRVDEFRCALSRGQLVFALIWIVGGVALTETGVLTIGNAAHVGGLVIGLLAAWRHFGTRPRLARWSMALTTSGVVIASFFCPWSSEWWLSKSARLASAADWEGAHDLAHWAARLSPDDPNPLRYCGWAAHHLGAYAEAVADFDAAIALVPDAYSFKVSPRRPACPRERREGGTSGAWTRAHVSDEERDVRLDNGRRSSRGGLAAVCRRRSTPKARASASTAYGAGLVGCGGREQQPGRQ